MKYVLFFLTLIVSTLTTAQVATTGVGSTPGTEIPRGTTSARLACFQSTPMTNPVEVNTLKVKIAKVGPVESWATATVLDASVANLRLTDNSSFVTYALIPQISSCPGATLTANTWTCEVVLTTKWLYATVSQICYDIDVAEIGPISNIPIMRGELITTGAPNATNNQPGFVPSEDISGPNRVLIPQRILYSGFEGN